MSPSDAAWQQLISALHASGRKAALAITGGGSAAIGELLRVPDASRLLIEAQVPYDAQALATFLGVAGVEFWHRFANAAGIAHFICVMARDRHHRAAEEDLVFTRDRAVGSPRTRDCRSVAAQPARCR
jgi:nicotinamide mononucleotide (NMN) deamidase PncC